MMLKRVERHRLPRNDGGDQAVTGADINIETGGGRMELTGPGNTGTEIGHGRQ